MAKPQVLKIKLESSANTGYFYVTRKNNANNPDKMSVKKYDPVKRQHVIFNEKHISK